jgi:hypothetical protein
MTNLRQHPGSSPLGHFARRAALATFAALLTTAPFHAALALGAPALGAAGSFAVLSGAAVTCTGSTLTGDVGSSVPGGPVVQSNCVINGAVLPGDLGALVASADFLAAYSSLAALPPGQCDVFLTGTLDAVTLPPGTYCFNAAATLTGLLTLDGPADGTWLFRVGTGGTGALTGTNFSMLLTGGAQASNVTWWVADAATMTTSNVQGTILSGAAISFTGGSLVGRDLAKAAVTLTGTTVTANSPLVLSFPPEPSPVVVVPPAPLPVPLAVTAPSLGSAGSFTILSGAAVTLTGSTVTGDAGSFAPGGAVTQTGSPVSGTIHAGDAVAMAASMDFLGAYSTLAALPPGQCDAFLSGTLANVTLPPGTYCFDAAATVAGQLTLEGPADGLWLFRVGTSGFGALTGTGFSVVMSGGGLPCNVTWWVADAATMTTSAVQGNILAGAASTFTGGSLVGRDLARAGVTFTGTAVTACSP